MTTTENPVKDIREKLGLTQQAMAEELGCSLTSARRFEYDKKTPGTTAVKKNLQRLARRAGIALK